MKKKFKLEDLEIESFITSDEMSNVNGAGPTDFGCPSSSIASCGSSAPTPTNPSGNCGTGTCTNDPGCGVTTGTLSGSMCVPTGTSYGILCNNTNPHSEVPCGGPGTAPIACSPQTLPPNCTTEFFC